MSEENSNILVEITDPQEFHCFRLVLNPRGTPEHGPLACHCGALPGEEHELGCPNAVARIEIMLHARSLVDLIHKCNLALCDWQAAQSQYLLDRLYKVTPEDIIALGRAENPEGYKP